MAKSKDISSKLDTIQRNLQKYGATPLVKTQLREVINELEKTQRQTAKYGYKQKAIEKTKYGASLSTQIDDLKQALSDVQNAFKTKDISKLAQARGLVNITSHKQKSVSTYFKGRTIKEVSTGRAVSQSTSSVDETLRRMFFNGMFYGLDESKIKEYEEILKKYDYGFTQALKNAISDQYKDWASDIALTSLDDISKDIHEKVLDDKTKNIPEEDIAKIKKIIKHLQKAK